MSGLAGAVFIFCSFWIYNYIDLEDNLEDFAEIKVFWVKTQDDMKRLKRILIIDTTKHIV